MIEMSASIQYIFACVIVPPIATYNKLAFMDSCKNLDFPLETI